MSTNLEALSSLKIERAGEATRRPHTRLGRVIVIGALSVGVSVAAWAFGRSRSIEVEAAFPTPSAGGGAPQASLNASGYVVAQRRATVSSRVTGKVQDVLIEEGMLVEKGALIARLEDSAVQAAIDVSRKEAEAARLELVEARVRLANSERHLARMLQLQTRALVSEEAVDTARVEVEAGRARLDALQAAVDVATSATRVRLQELADHSISAPFTGMIVSKDAQPGEMVSPVSAGGGFTRTGIATLVDMESLEIEVDVNEAFINRVSVGQKARAVLDAYPDWTIDCRVMRVVPTADRQKATVKVRIGFDRLDGRILPDMGVKVAFMDAQSDHASVRVAPRVPLNAVIESGSSKHVWRIRQGRAEKVIVRTGASTKDGIEVVSGLSSDDLVVVSSSGELTNGARVKEKT